MTDVQRRHCFRTLPLELVLGVARLMTVLLLLGSLASRATGADTKGHSVWLTDYQQAVKTARDQQRLLLVHFYADWCGPCRKMQRETLSSKALAEQFRGRVVAVKINTDRNAQLAKRFGIRSLPSDVFVTPGGRILSRHTGYQPRKRYLSLVARMESDFRNLQTTRLAKKQSEEKTLDHQGDARPASPPVPRTADDPHSGTEGSRPASRKTPSHKTSSRNKTAVGPDENGEFVGMEGYSPVALHEQRKWVEGKPAYAATYQGVTYWMADREEQTRFQANPRKYAPRLLGCDPVVLHESDRAVAGKIDYGAFFDGELFFFVSGESRETFRRTPLRYTRTRHVLHVDRIEGTARR